ncbi:MAG: AAA family ATPase [Terriglobia bacterium]
MIRTMQDFVESLKAALRVSTPLVAVRTPDPAGTVETVLGVLNGKGDETPVLHWDVMRGLAGLNEAGKAEARRVLDGGDPAITSVRPSDALTLAEKLGQDTILFFANGQRFFTDAVVAQGIWNLRDSFKAKGCMLALLMTSGSTLPPELAEDVLLMDEPLPSAEDLGRIVASTFASAGLPEPDTEVCGKAIDAVIGLAAFPAEQALAMSVTKNGLDMAGLWERKRQVIEQTPGLSVWRGGETFDHIGGVQNVKTFLRAVVAGAEPPRVVVFIDEIEKHLAGTGTDLSGVKTEMTGALLTWMQDRRADGCIFIGPPGAAKSAVAKATGNTAGIPTIAFDLAGMQSSLVGASGDRLRTALKIVDAVSQGRTLFIATCNKIATLPPELRRRFTLGTFFFDLPSAEERGTIWKIYTRKYLISSEPPDDEGWTGAEIEECCRKAYRLKISLQEAARYIVPVSRSASEEIKSLRLQASGKFISASALGVYQYEEAAALKGVKRVFRDMTA